MKDAAQTYFEALMASVTINVIVPLVLFMTMFSLFLWVLVKAQRTNTRNEHFDVSQFLRDESGKLSSVRLYAFVALAVHTWVIAVETVNGRVTTEQMVVYGVTWSSSLILKGAVEKWDGRLPWAKT